MPVMPEFRGNARRAHEAIELAKLAVALARLRGKAGYKDPEVCLEEACDLILAAGRVIDKKEREQFADRKK